MSFFPEGQPIDISKGQVQVLDNDIFHVRFESRSLLEIDDVKEVERLLSEMLTHKPMKILMEFLKYASVTSEAREYAQEIRLPLKAEAMVFHGLAQRILVQAYVYRLKNSQDHPINSFTSREKAVEWLNAVG